jgi:pilus assembly protein Flp/PilA
MGVSDVSLLFAAFQPLLSRLAEREEGQGLAEYGLILALVAVVAITALTGLGSAIVSTLGNIVNAM